MPNPTLLADADSLTIWLLDMGTEQNGDCLVCRRGHRTILIDGGHPGDFQDRNGFKSIPNQLAGILNQQPPCDIDLLVVTHCHASRSGHTKRVASAVVGGSIAIALVHQVLQQCHLHATVCP